MAGLDFVWPLQQHWHRQALTAIASNTQCADYGRKKALEYLGHVGHPLIGKDLDCANISDIKMPPRTKMSQLSFVGGTAWRAIFDGVDLRKSALLNSDFSDASFKGADLQGAILGRHIGYDKKIRNDPGHCFRGAIRPVD